MYGLLYFGLTQYVGYIPENRLSVMPIHGLEQYGDVVGRFYMLLFATAALSCVGITADRSSEFSLSALSRQIFDIFRADIATVFMLLVSVLTLAHLVDFDLSYFWSYTGYLSINNSELVGLSNPLSRFYNNLGPTLAGLAGAVGVVAYRAGYRSLALWSAILFTYGFALSLSSASRETGVMIMMVVSIRYLLAPRFDLLFWAGILMVMFSLLYAIEARSAYLPMGLAHVGQAMSNVLERNPLEGLVGMMTNISTGAINLAGSMRVEASYETPYKLLTTMSPLPSAIDGWAQLRSSNEVRITPFNPFNAYAEVSAFGKGYVAFFLLQLFIVLRVLNGFVTTRVSLLGLLAVALSYLWIMRLTQYSLRTDNKLLVLVTIIAVVELVRRIPGRVNQIS